MASLSFDPPVSENQRRAMFAARSGNSTIGIPKSVGEKFVGPGHDIVVRGSEVHPPRPRVETTPPKPTRATPEPVKARMTPTARDRISAACDRRAARFAGDKDADAHPTDIPDAAGIMFVTPQDKILFMRRSKENYDDYGAWDFPGGHLDEGETSIQAARRETEEETGHEPEGDLRVIDRQEKGDGKGQYVTYVNFCESEFEPDLDDEHDEFQWRTIDDAPQPLHHGVEHTLDHIDDMEVEMGQDVALALDYSSSRSYDADGHLHVSKTPISKANVCPYLGSEIPDSDELGLDPKKIYHLLRHPEELAKAAATFNGKPLLIEHEPTSAEDHQADLTVGSTGNEAVYEHPYLYNSLVVWPGDVIKDIENGKQKQLSSAYRYKADMTPGVYAGVNYDGIMRSLVGNHVAIVREGRAGADVVIGDSRLEGYRMPANAQKLSRQATRVIDALVGFLQGKLAKDVKLPQALFTGITRKNYSASKPVLLKALTKQLKGKLASDASLGAIHGLLDSLSPGEKEGTDNTAASSAIPVATGHTTALPHQDEDMHNTVREHLMGKLAPDDIEDLIGKMKGGKPGEDEKDEDDESEDEITVASGLTKESDPQFQAADDPPPFKGVPKVGKGPGEDRAAHDGKGKQRMGKDVKPAGEKKVRQAAMDSAIADAVKKTEIATIARLNGIAEAKERVRPWIGQISGAFDSAESIYRHVLKARSVKDADKLHADALLPILENLPRSTARPNIISSTVAQDAKAADIPSFADFIKAA